MTGEHCICLFQGEEVVPEFPGSADPFQEEEGIRDRISNDDERIPISARDFPGNL